MSTAYFILDENRSPVRVQKLDEWEQFMKKPENRIVGRENAGEALVSTVFTGVDHNYIRGEVPVIFETMVFGGTRDGFRDEYATWEEARDGHSAIVEALLAGTTEATSPTDKA